MKKIIPDQIARWLLLLVLIGGYCIKGVAQPATVSKPFSVGRNTCGGSIAQISFYNYNGTSNTLSNDVALTCIPQLRIGTGTTNQFTSSLASVSFNPKDQRIYYLWTRNSPLRTFAWSWPLGTCPTTTAPRLDSMRSFAYDILGVAFDANGNGWMVEFSLTGPPYTALLRSIDFTTGVMGLQDTLVLTGGAKIHNASQGDVTMSPSGQMFFVVNNKLFTPDYKSYAGTGKKITCTYIDTVRTGSGGLIGLTYAEGEMVGAYSGGTCPFFEIDPLTGTNVAITKSGTVPSASDLATVISGIGVSKRLVSVNPTPTPGVYDVQYDVYVRNYGNVPVTNVQVTDNLTLINPLGTVSNVTTSFVSNPAGLVLNGAFNGSTNINLLNGTVTLPTCPIANNNATIRISCRLSNILPGVVYNNSAVATGRGFQNVSLRDSSTNGSSPDLNTNDKPDDVGESQPTPLLISVTAQTPPCSSLQTILYSETFGTGPNGTNLVGTNTPGTDYTGSTTAPLTTDQYMLTANAQNGDGARWISLTDHTTGTGRMMVVNADATNKVFFRDTISGICPGQQYSMFFYAAFIGNSSYQTICDAFGGFRYPKIMMTIRDPISGSVITQISTTDIVNTTWLQYGLKWVMPNFNSVIIELSNDAPGGCGNDLALDDIQFGTCDPMPSVTVTAPSAGCLGGSTTFSAILNDPDVIPGAKDYQWQVSPDGITGWTNIGAVTSTGTYTINPVNVTHTGKYYRVIMAAQGNLALPGCRDTSNSFVLTSKTSSTAPTLATRNRNNICPGDAVTLQVSGGTLGTNAVYRWYAGGCGAGAAIGTGTSIIVNPTVTTTYYVRIEGDCENTTCVSIPVTVNCDIDDDDDGITDLAESGGVDPLNDDDFDGLENYRDPSYPGYIDTNGDNINDNFDKDKDGIINELDLDSDNDGIPDVVEAGGVDANGDGKIDNFTDADGDGLSGNVDATPTTGQAGSGSGLGTPDLDGDGIPNLFDLDSDNDGIPDVREVFGTDAGNDGKIDGYTDTDGDGYSDNVDTDLGNDGTAEAPTKALLRTGPDGNNDGRADNYPFKNFDGDAKANAYDLDSDNDGLTDVREAGFTDADNNGMSDGTKGSDGWDDVIDALPALTIRNTDTDPGTNYNPDYLDIDSDNDGIPDNVEGVSTTGYQLPLYTDTDGDGLDNRYDNIAGFGGNGFTPNDQDVDGIPDYRDADTDNDSMADIIEGNDYNLNGLPDDVVTLTGIDTDGDGLDDRFDNNNTNKKGTSAYMGPGGSITGDAAPGSNTMVQRRLPANSDRDWRFLGSVLDVNFLSFAGTRQGESVKLRWVITCDKIIDHFDIERSTDGVHFVKVGEQKGTGTIAQTASFTYTDNTVGVNSKTIYYRIKAVCLTNAPKNSQVISIHKQATAGLSILPNPASSYVVVNLTAMKDATAGIQVLDAGGRTVIHQRQQVYNGSNSFSIEGAGRLSEGVYNIRVKLGDELYIRKLIIQR